MFMMAKLTSRPRTTDKTRHDEPSPAPHCYLFYLQYRRWMYRGQYYKFSLDVKLSVILATAHGVSSQISLGLWGCEYWAERRVWPYSQLNELEDLWCGTLVECKHSFHLNLLGSIGRRRNIPLETSNAASAWTQTVRKVNGRFLLFSLNFKTNNNYGEVETAWGDKTQTLWIKD